MFSWFLNINDISRKADKFWGKFMIIKDNHVYQDLGPVVQSVVSLTSLLRVISLTVLTDSIYNILICKSYSHFFSKKFQHICVSLDVNFNESLINDVVSFEQLGPDLLSAVNTLAFW